MANNTVAREKLLPFEPLVPNEETIKALKQARSGNGITKIKGVDDLMMDLNADNSAHQTSSNKEL